MERESRHRARITSPDGMRLQRLQDDLCTDGRGPFEEVDVTDQIAAKANAKEDEDHARHILDKLAVDGVLDEKETILTPRIPDFIAIAEEKAHPYPTNSTLIVVMDALMDVMVETVRRMGAKKADGKRVGRVQWNGQMYSVKYRKLGDMFEVPSARSEDSDAFVISESQMDAMNSCRINVSRRSKFVSRRSMCAP